MRTLALATLALVLLAGAGTLGADEGKKAKAAPSNYEHLKFLDKQVGAWEAETKTTDAKTVPFTVTSKWLLDKNFFQSHVEFKDGRQYIRLYGWDAKAEKLKVWTFRADGIADERSLTQNSDGSLNGSTVNSMGRRSP